MNLLLVAIIISNPVITEVMLDPKGPETGSLSPGDRNEFLEIFNHGDDTIDLAQFKLQDNAETDSIVPFPEILNFYPNVKSTTKIPPGGYGIILDREYTLEGENYMPYNPPPGISVMTTKDTDLGNGLSTNDTIKLFGPNGVVASSFGAGNGFPIPSQDGLSFERKYYYGPDDVNNWRYSENKEGHTCGYLNSVSKPYTAKILSIKAISDNAETRFEISLKNTGTEVISNPEIFYEFIGDYPCGQEIKNITVLPDSQCLFVLGPMPIPPGYYTIKVKISVTEWDSTIAEDSTRFFTGETPIVINEIMYNSETEWVEIYNNSNIPFSLKGFSIADPVTRSAPISQDVVLFPGEYTVLASRDFPLENKIVLSGFPSLNNTDDTVYLFGSFGECFDVVPYSSRWGGGYNVSLERLSPKMDSRSTFTWMSSREGSTPGKKNSVSIDLPQKSEILSLSRKVLSPSRGIPVIVGNLEFPEYPIYATVELYRIDGIKVLTIMENTLLKDGKGYFTIPPASQPFNLSEGMYLLIIKGKNQSGKLFVKREILGILN